MTQENIGDILEIQRLVGKFSNLEGNAAEQQNLLTRDVQFRVYMGEEMLIEIKGIANFEKSIRPVFNSIKRCHYLNGQHVIDFLTKDTATGLLSCRAVHITEEDGKDIFTDHCLLCEDIYTKKNGKWLIKGRDAHYYISDKHALGF